MADWRNRLRPPPWWMPEPGPASRAALVALLPAEAGYRLAAGAYHAAYDRGLLRSRRAPVAAISVGNLTVGGAGKTPFTRFLLAELRARGRRPAVLHGGYGDDEPALHRAWNPDLPVIVQRDQVAAAFAAAEAGADVMVLDDGFQHRRLARHLDVVLVPAESWTPRPRLLPRGPWREPPRALRRADLVAVTRRTASEAEAERVLREVERFAPEAARLVVALRPAGWRRGDAGSRREDGPEGATLAVAAIADPEAFARNAAEAGASVRQVLRFPDHHAYSAKDVARIALAAAGDAIVTTEKDWVKLRPLAAGLDVWVLEQEVVLESGSEQLSAAIEGLPA